MKKTLEKLIEIVQQHAAEQIMPRYRHVSYRLKQDGSPVTEADSEMQKAMISSLNQHWPDYVVLGEEMTEAEQQAQLDNSATGLWVLDPLDGTSNFANGIPVFSVSIALVLKNEVVLGVIYDPNRDETFSAIKGEGAWLNGEVLQGQTDRELLKQCTAQIDFKRLTPGMRETLCREHLFASQRNFGSGALDWCWLAMGRCQISIHGGQKLWDYVAGQLILNEAGGCSETFAGEVVFQKTLKTRSVMATVNPVLFTQLKQYFVLMGYRK